jgi:glycosyltransferase involved in cell wall biosynthesis
VFISSLPENQQQLPQWRGMLLAQAIQKTRHATATVVDYSAMFRPDNSAQMACANADIVIIQANSHPAVLAAIQHWKTKGKTVVLDLGPDCLALPETTSANRTPPWLSGGLEAGAYLTDMIQWGLRLVDAVITPSHRLIEDIRGLANAILIPDYIDLENFLSLGPAPHDGIVIGWKNSSFDASGVLATGLKSALEHICKVRPQVRIEIFGGDPAVARQLALPPEVQSFYPLDNPGEWPARLSGVDIGLAPLSGNLDERRGWSDVLEFMAMKIPWVASHGPAYYELRPYGWIIENNASTWERVLLDVIDHLSAYAEEALSEPYLFAISQGIEENVEAVLSAFTDIQNVSQAQRPQNEIG